MLKLRQLAFNRADVILGIGIMLIVTGAVAALIVIDKARSFLGVPAILAGWVAILLAFLGWATQITSIRQSLIRLLSSEVRALQYGLASMNMFNFWANVYNAPEEGASGFADAPRREDYFQIFHSVGNNIGHLHPDVAESVVRFYTYLKMSRDAAAPLSSWNEHTPPLARRTHVEYVVKLLALSMLWGFVALWFMGFNATPEDRKFVADIQSAYDSVIGPGAFETVRQQHPKRTALDDFLR